MTNRTENSVSFEWLDLRRLTEYAAVSERTLRAWIHDPVDPLPAVCVGRKILVRRQEFDAWLERHRVRPLEAVVVDGIVREMVEGVSSGR
jgi:excisionase family DNA binding protein